MPIDRRVEKHRRRDEYTAMTVEDDAGEIARLADDGRIARPVKMIVHLLHQAADAVAHDLRSNGVDHGASIFAFEDQIAVAIDKSVPAGRHDRRRVELLDDGGTGESHANR